MRAQKNNDTAKSERQKILERIRANHQQPTSTSEGDFPPNDREKVTCDTEALFTDVRNKLLDYIEQELDGDFPNLPYAQYKRAEEVEALCHRLARYFAKVKAEYGIRKGYQWPEWTKKLKPRKGERLRRTSPHFKKAWELLWGSSLSYQKTKLLYEAKSLPMHKHKGQDRYLVLSAPDIGKAARELDISEDMLRKLIRQWTAENGGPAFRVGFTGRKRDTGRSLYAVGYWLAGMRRVTFFTAKTHKEWFRRQLFRPE